MIKTVATTLILFMALHLSAQQEIPSFGKVSHEELSMTACDFEPNASALKLFDVHDVEFEMFAYGGIKTKTERRVRIKVFNEKGYEHANIRIPYLSKKGIAKIKNLGGYIHTLEPDGKIKSRKLEGKDFYREKANEFIGLVTFTFPQLSPGSVIEYRYTTVENNILGLDPWIIQGDIPVAYTSYVVQTPVRSVITEKVFGTDTVEQFSELLKYDQFRKNVYYKRNVPSFIPEPFMSSEKDHLQKAIFLLRPAGGNFFSPAQQWIYSGQQLLRSKYIETQIGKVIPGTERLIDSAKKIEKAPDRIAYLLEAMHKKWPMRIQQTTKSEDLAEAWKDNDATSAEVNLILMNLLEKADVQCVPVLVSTRDNGFIDKNFASFSQFNGIDVMAFDSSKHYLLDATIKNLPFDVPPANVLNREVLVLVPNNITWLFVADQRPLYRQQLTIFAEMKDDGTIEGGTSVQYFDYAKADRLDSLAQAEAQGNKGKDGTTPGFTVTKFQRDSVYRPEDPLFENIEFTYEPNSSDDFVFIDPQVLVGKTKNPFIRETRNTDIDLGSNQLVMVTLQINLNDHFEIDHLPSSMIIRAPDSSCFYSITYSTSKGTIYMTQQFEINRSQFTRDEYEGLRDFFKQMYTLMAKEIVLKKKVKAKP